MIGPSPGEDLRALQRCACGSLYRDGRSECFRCWVQPRLEALRKARAQAEADDWYAAEVERMRDRAPA
jgi:uncharacterized membrane-anchored protein